MKPLIVGECNPWQNNEADAMCFAMHCDPPHASGGRLCYNIMGLEERQYLRMFDRTDLCWPKWSIVAAREKARQLVGERGESDVIVMCGAKVAAAFGFIKWEPLRIYRGTDYPHRILTVGKGPAFVSLPHPSGRNPFWWDIGAADRARMCLREAGVLPA